MMAFPLPRLITGGPEGNGFRSYRTGRHMIDKLSDAKEPGTCRHATNRMPTSKHGINIIPSGYD